MLNINIVCVGKLKEQFWKDAEKEYSKRLTKFCNLKIIEIDDVNQGEMLKDLEIEGKAILNQIKGKTYLLAIKGKEYSSEDFAEELENLKLNNSQISFVIGGSNGVSNDVVKKIPNKISFGKVTYPHNLARIILLEQIYRAFMINSGSKYHK